MLGDYAFPGNIFRGRHKATPIENPAEGKLARATSEREGRSQLCALPASNSLRCYIVTEQQPDTNRNSVNAFNGGGEKFSDSPGGGFCARFSSFQTPALDDFCTSPRPTHPLLVNYFLVSFPFHPRYFLCARSMVNVGDLTYASDN